MPDDPLRPPRPPLDERERDARIASGEPRSETVRRVQEKAAQAGMRINIGIPVEDLQDPEAQVPEVEWVGFDDWPPGMLDKITELQELRDVFDLLTHPAFGRAGGDEVVLGGEELIRLGMKGLRYDIYRMLIALHAPGEPASPSGLTPSAKAGGAPSSED